MHEREKISITMHSIKSRFVTGPSNTLFAGVYVCTFQPGNVTGCGSVGLSTSLQGIMAVRERSIGRRDASQRRMREENGCRTVSFRVWDQQFTSERGVELNQLLEAEFTTHCTTFEAS